MPPRPTVRTKAARQARRLRQLLEDRLAAFEQALQEEGALADAASLEKQARAMLALMKALETAADMEAATAATGKADDSRRDRNLRRRLAQRLEALCADTRPPCRDGGPEQGGD